MDLPDRNDPGLAAAIRERGKVAKIIGDLGSPRPDTTRSSSTNSQGQLTSAEARSRPARPPPRARCQHIINWPDPPRSVAPKRSVVAPGRARRSAGAHVERTNAVERTRRRWSPRPTGWPEVTRCHFGRLGKRCRARSGACAGRTLSPGRRPCPAAREASTNCPPLRTSGPGRTALTVRVPTSSRRGAPAAASSPVISSRAESAGPLAE